MKVKFDLEISQRAREIQSALMKTWKRMYRGSDRKSKILKIFETSK